MTIKARFKAFHGFILAGLLLALLWPLGSLRSATAQTGKVKKQMVELAIKQGSRKTAIKMFVENGKVVKTVAHDAGGERLLRRVDSKNRAKVTCEQRAKKCVTFELESGERIKVCFCPEVASTELLVGLTSGPGTAGGHVKVFDGVTGAEIRSGATRPAGNGKTYIDLNGNGATGNPHVKVFSGATGAEVRGGHVKMFDGVTDFDGGGGAGCTAANPCCYEDYELQMSICTP